jgi:hypothetical protein
MYVWIGQEEEGTWDKALNPLGRNKTKGERRKRPFRIEHPHST